jgi:hypothetical protein
MIAPLEAPKYTQNKSLSRRKVVQQDAKHFAAKLNKCLDDMDAPSSVRERATILSKMLDIPKHQAWGILEGQQIPDRDTIIKIIDEFEVDPKWLSDEK